MASIIKSHESDMFINLRQNGKKYDGCVSESVANLKRNGS